MSWAALSTTLDSKPRVLAGPVLRKVTPESVTVWLATRKPGKVTLKVFVATDSARLLEGARHTVALGSNLHLVAVTARRQPPAAPLIENVIYRYQLTFDFDDNLSTDLATATGNAQLAYPPYTQPTFCLPPADVNNLRILHSSCRIPHGNGRDCLPIVSEMIAQTAKTPLQRPHQLLLMGDQIYADDVGAAFLLLLTDAANTLLGWKETLPVPGGPKHADQLPPFARRDMLDDAGFTSEDLDSHLMALGEYLCMYLFVWSDVLWSSTNIPTWGDVVDTLKASLGGYLGKFQNTLTTKHDSIVSDIAQVQLFHTSLPEVRRALANIPTYMICDDHEVTDDWNMTLEIAAKLHDDPLGRRIIRNGVVAYAVCQHWGNCPEQFLEADGSLPGTALLKLLDGGNETTYVTNATKIDPLVAVHSGAEITAHKAVYHDPGSLIFNYTIESPGHQVIVTDTRTWRAFPRGDGNPPDLLPAGQITAQIAQMQPATGNRALLVVLTTNAPPVEPIRSATRHHILTNVAQHVPDIYEAWDLPTQAFDRLVKALSDRLPQPSGELKGPVVLLSGDVHFSFASRMLYKATGRYEDATNRPATMVIAQLVSSSQRKQTDSTLGMGDEGYTYAPHAFLKPLIGPHVTEFYAGYRVTTTTIVGKAWELVAKFGLKPFPRRAAPDLPTVRLTDRYDVLKAPDFIYQLDYLNASASSAAPMTLAPIAALPSGATADQRKQALNTFNTVTGNYRQYTANPSMKKQIVGLNNLGEVTFQWPNTEAKKVLHTVRWYHPQFLGLAFVNWVVPLDPADVNFPYRADKFKVVP